MPCKQNDPFCPCQDGDQCHYEGDNPMTPPVDWTGLNGTWVDGGGSPVTTAPVQKIAGNTGNGRIPFAVAEEAYKEYSAVYGTSQTLERLNERGGFGAEELMILLYDRCKRLEREKK
jgi:hypothetical protein